MCKSYLWFLLVVLFLGFPKVIRAAPCDNFPQIIISGPFRAITIPKIFHDIANATNLAAYSSPDNTQYWLCFSSGRNYSPSISSTLVLQNNTDRPVVISGLNIDGTLVGANAVLKILDGKQTTIIQKSAFNHCANCLESYGEGVTIGGDVSLQCPQKGVGLKLLSDNNAIMGTTITDCDIGVQVGDGVHSANNNHFGYGIPGSVQNFVGFDSSKNQIPFQVLNGSGNYFDGRVKDTSNYRNDTPQIISLSSGTNGNVKTPIVLPMIGAGTASLDFLNFTDADGDALKKGMSAKATFQIKIPYKKDDGELEMLTKKYAPFTQDGYQSRFDLHLTSASDQPDNDGNYLFTYEIPYGGRLEYYCAESILVFHHKTLGSSSNSSVHYLNPPHQETISGLVSICQGVGPGVVSAPSMNDPGVVSVPAVNNGVIAPSDVASPPGDDPKKKESKDGMTAGNTISEIAGSGDASKIGGLGGGCTLVPHQYNDGLILFVIVFLPVIVVLTGIRLRADR